MRQRISGIISLFALCVEYIVLRYPLLGLHGMKQWPLFLVVIGLIVIVIGLAINDPVLPVLTAFGYIAGFILGYVFQSDYGIGLNNMWIIWTGCYAAAIFIGIIVCIAKRIRSHK